MPTLLPLTSTSSTFAPTVRSWVISTAPLTVSAARINPPEAVLLSTAAAGVVPTSAEGVSTAKVFAAESPITSSAAPVTVWSDPVMTCTWLWCWLADTPPRSVC